QWHDIPATADDPNALRGRRVLVMGLGLLGGGVSAARYAVEQGAAEVIVTDLRSADVLAPSVAKLAGLPIRYVLGRHDPADFARADVVVRNPNVPRHSLYLAAARAAGARVEMEIAWFFRACPGKIAGVTGTRGKSTTTLLLHRILSEAGWDPLLGGNLGGIETLSLLPEITPDRWTVLELGNWMLEGLHTVRRSPQLAIFTNLLPDHLDAYDSMEDYGQAKTSIFRYQRPGDIAIFNAENEFSRRYAGEAPTADVWLYSVERGVSYPRDIPGETRPFRYADANRLRGAHNVANVQAATLAAELLGVPEAEIRTAVASFGGAPHRLEVVRRLDGVTWVNDSASTAPVAGIAALRSFDEPIVLIAGGNTKQLDHSAWAEAAATRAKRIILLKGSATEAFAADVRAAAGGAGRADPIEGVYDDFAAAIQRARALAEPGDVVLLSPGFTSFGLFLHEFDRGDQFRRLVQALPENL
ncbi:MAG TPA: UDP-N-acetylmuramoyl-L-alanine--D-glutamate ligase, partial [Ktedonobacterales bacterium]|nr:UDP-N-acetylmuramoyl-L-alanine--D-glutamate ligase [Ktedonobacterales bacterium]